MTFTLEIHRSNPGAPFHEAEYSGSVNGVEIKSIRSMELAGYVTQKLYNYIMSGD